ncbi:MAG TPA: transporter substrate-binding domain-containing protein [Syntrophales bacterium]|nr:transporter substrate-binding domain-containing protein [Syntrophales bacterium]
MMKRLNVVVFTCLAILVLVLQAGLAVGDNSPMNLRFLTEQYPPYNFQENGLLKGISVDLLDRISSKQGMNLKIQEIAVLPWTEGYRQVLKDRNKVLFSMTRTPEREKMFQWVGPISPTRVVLFTRKDATRRMTDRWETQKLRIGAIRDDIGHQLALKEGKANWRLVLRPRSQDLVHLLEEGVIDAWAYEETAGRWFIKHAAANPGDIEAARVLFEGELYYAFHREASPAIIAAFQQTLDELKNEKDADGSSAYEKIFDRYLKPRYVKDQITAEQVIKLVSLTAAALRADATATLKEINAGRHPYRDRENPALYVFAYDQDINMVAHGDNKMMVGKNFRGKTDVEGKSFRDEIVKKALSKGSGWEDYIYTSPKQSGLYFKTTYYQLATGSDGGKYIICAGKFKDQP